MSAPSLSTPLWILLGVLAVAQITLAVIALVDLVRRPEGQVTLPKWLWALIIVGVSTIGAIAYLAAGRRSAPVAEVITPPRATAADTVADELYGRRDGA